jgi:hypothetical protein
MASGWNLLWPPPPLDIPVNICVQHPSGFIMQHCIMFISIFVVCLREICTGWTWITYAANKLVRLECDFEWIWKGYVSRYANSSILESTINNRMQTWCAHSFLLISSPPPHPPPLFAEAEIKKCFSTAFSLCVCVCVHLMEFRPTCGGKCNLVPRNNKRRQIFKWCSLEH